MPQDTSECVDAVECGPWFIVPGAGPDERWRGWSQEASSLISAVVLRWWLLLLKVRGSFLALIIIDVIVKESLN